MGILGNIFAVFKAAPKVEKPTRMSKGGNGFGNYSKPPTGSSLDVRNWKTYMDWAQRYPNYDRRYLYELYKDCLLDAHLYSIVQTRKLKTMSNAYVVDGLPEDTYLSPEFRTLMELTLDSIFWGFSMVEYGVDGNKIVYIEEIERLSVSADRQLFLPDQTNPNTGYPFDDYDDWLFIGSKKSLGLLSMACPHVIRKGYSFSDWSQHIERFGMPILMYKTDSTDDSYKRGIRSMLEGLGSNGWILGDTEDEMIQIQGTKTDPYKIYLEFINLTDAQLSKLVLGQTMTTDNGSSRSQGEVHERVLEAYTAADMQLVQNWLNRYILPKMFGAKVKFRWDVAQNIDPEPNPVDNNKGKKKGLFGDTVNFTGLPVAIKAATGSNEKAFNKLAKEIFEGAKVDASLIENSKGFSMLTEATFKVLAGAYDKQKKGFGIDDAFGADPALRQVIEENLFYFSAAKTYEQAQAISKLLLDDDGTFRDYADFVSAVKSIYEDYNISYLQSEYRHAIACANAIRRWQIVSANPDEFDIMYDAVNDGRTRPAHKALDGIVKPVGDAFWNRYAPPNDWGCRCILRRVPKGTESAPMPDILPVLPAFFDGNPGRDGIAFRAGHPVLKRFEESNAMVGGKLSYAVAWLKAKLVISPHVKPVSGIPNMLLSEDEPMNGRIAADLVKIARYVPLDKAKLTHIDIASSLIKYKDGTASGMFYMDEYDGKAHRILLYRDAYSLYLLAHELGHMLDTRIGNGSYASESGLMSELMEAVKLTDTYIDRAFYSQNAIQDKIRIHNLYLIEVAEIWAQLFSQYIWNKYPDDSVSFEREFWYKPDEFAQILPLIEEIINKLSND